MNDINKKSATTGNLVSTKQTRERLRKLLQKNPNNPALKAIFQKMANASKKETEKEDPEEDNSNDISR